MSNKYKSLANNTLIFTIGSLGSKIITFFLVPLYTNYLTTTQYGTADLVINFANMLLPVISLVIQDSVLRFSLSKDCEPKSVIINALWIFIFGTIFSFALYPLLGLYPAIKEWRLYLILTLICYNANNILSCYTKAKEKNKLYAFSGILQTFILASLNIVLIVFVKTGVKGYLLSNLIAHLVTDFVLFFGSGTHKDLKSPKINKPLMKSMLAYSVPLIANNISWWILTSSDKIMLEQYISADAVGLYTAASKIPNLLSIITSIFATAWTISSIKEYESEQDKLFYANIFKGFSLAMFLGGAILLGATKVFSTIYLGKSFLESWIYTPALIIGTVFYSFSSFFGAIYGAVKKNVPTTISTIIAAIINISVNFLLIPKIGITAASLSTAVSFFVIGIIRMLNSRKYLKFPINFQKFFLNSFLIIVQAIFISFNFYIYLASAISLFLILLINFRDLKLLADYFINILRRKKHEP